MTNSLKKLVSSLALAVAALVGSQSTLLAIPISGLVEIVNDPVTGYVTLDNTSLGAATTVTSVTGAKVSGTSTGDFATTAGSNVTWNSFTWNPVTLPVLSLWSFTSGGRVYSFDLTALAVVQHTATFLDLSGAGYLKISGDNPDFDDTFGTFTFQVTNTAGQHPAAKFNFNSSNATPDGGTTALLIGVGLVAMSLVAHRRRLTKA